MKQYSQTLNCAKYSTQQKNDQERPKKNIFTTSQVEQSEYFKLFWKFLLITSKKVKINEILLGKRLIISNKIKILYILMHLYYLLIRLKLNFCKKNFINIVLKEVLQMKWKRSIKEEHSTNDNHGLKNNFCSYFAPVSTSFQCQHNVKFMTFSALFQFLFYWVDIKMWYIVFNQ